MELPQLSQNIPKHKRNIAKFTLMYGPLYMHGDVCEYRDSVSRLDFSFWCRKHCVFRGRLQRAGEARIEL